MAVTAAMVKRVERDDRCRNDGLQEGSCSYRRRYGKAVEFLREKGLAGAAKKAGRIAAEGIVDTLLTADEKTAVVVEVNAETDFVAKNAVFQAYVADVAAQALALPQLIWTALWLRSGLRMSP